MDVSHVLEITARDGFFFKDGRGWSPGGSGRGHSLEWPFPPTVLGALRAAWGKARERALGRPLSKEEWQETLRHLKIGALLPLRKPLGVAAQPGHLLWPAPADSVWFEGHQAVDRLSPEPLAEQVRTMGSRHRQHEKSDLLDRAREALWWPRLDDSSKPLPDAPPWWTMEQFTAWLCGEPVSVLARSERQAMRLPARVEVHVGIDEASFSSREGVLYAFRMLETLQAQNRSDPLEWSLGAQVQSAAEAPPGWQDVPLILGGEGRLGQASALDAQLLELPEALKKSLSSRHFSGIRLVAVSPVCFERGWLPDGFEVVQLTSGEEPRIEGKLPGIEGRVQLRAALVPRSVSYSGWDMLKRQPRMTVRLVPAGSVYFFERLEGVFSPEELRRLWLMPWGTRTGDGFGRVVPGQWERKTEK